LPPDPQLGVGEPAGPPAGQPLTSPSVDPPVIHPPASPVTPGAAHHGEPSPTQVQPGDDATESRLVTQAGQISSRLTLGPSAFCCSLNVPLSAAVAD
jgi:hypothetical protein